jgi:hypothetical protein
LFRRRGGTRAIWKPVFAKAAINSVTLGAAIVNWRYTIGEDWSGDPAIFFWVTLSDEASKRRNLSDATKQIIDPVKQRVDPFGQWGLIPYFSFRSQSEQARLREEVFG